MTMLEAVVTTDWHLDSFKRFFETNESGLDAQFKEIDKPFQYALEHGIKHVFMLGDIGEHPTLSDAAKQRLLTLLLKYDGLLNIYFITGNHDVADKESNSMTLFKCLADSKRFKSIYIYDSPHATEIDGIAVNFLPWPAHTAEYSERACLNLAHVELTGAMRDNGSVVEQSGITRRKKDYWIVGHLHTYQTGARFLYPGTGWQKNFGEQGPKGFCHIKAYYRDDALVVKHEHIDADPALKLFNLKDVMLNDFPQISTDPRHLYRITMAEGEQIPESIRQMPNVIQVISHKGVLKDVAESEQDVREDFDYTEGLEQALSHLTPEQVSRALELVKQALPILSNTASAA